MKISLIQSDIVWNDPEASVSHCTTLADQASSAGGELLVFPEMFSCGFSLPVGDIARRSCEVGLSFLCSYATKHGVSTLASTPELGEDSDLYNTAWLCTPDGEVSSYRKMHLFSFGEETSRYSAGSSWITRTINGVRVTPFICYDLRFPLPFYHCAPETDLFVVVANWPTQRREHWLTLLRARAIESQAYVAGVNRVGSGGDLQYSGDSALFAPDGTQLGHLGPYPSTFTAEIDPERVQEWRSTFPALRDRRDQTYNQFYVKNRSA